MATETKTDCPVKLSKPLLQAIAVAVAVTVVTSSCTKENVDPEGVKAKKKNEAYNCLACGMG